ncbi:MAG: 30S ribosomal protein S3 [Patescibacteria group bacterium]
MGNKVHPKVFRLGINKTWESKWFARRHEYSKNLRQDVQIRKYLKTKLKEAGVSNIEIDRSTNNVTITIFTAKPGIVIGRGGQGAEVLKKQLKMMLMEKTKYNIKLNVQEVDKPDLNSQIVVQSMIEQLERRMPFRRVLKQTISQVRRAGAKGVRAQVAGRLNGAEIARTEHLSEGSIPLHTLRADIDFGRGQASTTYGSIGVKVWIYKGEIFKKDKAKTGDNLPGSRATKA